MSLISNSWILVLLWIIVYSDPAFSCGGLVTGRKGEIKTPNFPVRYWNNLDCTWTIQVDDNNTITIEFLTFNVQKGWFGCEDKFLIYDGPNTISTELTTQPCGNEIPGPLHSSGNILTLTFQSDSSRGHDGVRLKWKVSDKFILHTEAKSWEEANSVCMNDGGYLAVKTDLNEHLISNLLGDRSDSFWIGEYYTPWIWLKGCYKDQDLNLTSSKSNVKTRENEAKVCQYYCQHTVYFGMRGSECYCLTTEDMDKLQFAQSWYECRLFCPGNDKETCGGAYSLTVYMNDVCWKNSSTWVAKIEKTISGKTCQAWSSNIPHAHTFHDDDMFPDGSEVLASNYCRDPDGRGAPWCFTEDPKVPWQFCDAPPCQGTCWSDSTTYTGHLNVTALGHKCRNWIYEPPPNNRAFHDDSSFPDSTVNEAVNFCRSPNKDPLLWCYLDSAANGMVWDYCGSPPCFDSTEVEENGELCRLFWIKDNKFYFKEHNCGESERFWCFVGDELSEVSDRNDTRNFSKARQSCRLPSLYSLSNYKTLFGLILANSNKLKVKHWLGNFRGEDNTHNKNGVSTPSACKTIEKTDNGSTTSFQPNCQLSLGFICQKDAVLCGGQFYNNSGDITSPGYPNEYENNEYCEWEIHVSEEKVIEIVFHDFDIEQTGSKTCPFDYIEVLENHIKPPKSIRKICGESSNVSIISASNQVLITFKTDKAVSKRGFYLEWMSDLIPTTTSTTDTTTTSTIDATTTSAIYKQSSSTTKNNEKKETDKLIKETQDNHKAGLGGATLAGIVIGAVLAILVVMVIVLVVLVLKRKKERKAGAQTILELKALENTETAKTPSNSETPQQTGDSGNPYERLHTPDLYVHTYDSMVHETGDMHDHFDSDKTDSLDKDVKDTDAYANETLQKMQKPNVYDFTTAPEGQNHQETFNVIKADKTDSLHNKDEDSIKNEYMNSGSNEIVTKGFHDRENYLMPIGENLNNTMGHTNTAGIQTKNTSKNDDYYNKEVDIEDDTQQNVSDDKTNEQNADSEQHLYTEIENSEQDYENP